MIIALVLVVSVSVFAVYALIDHKIQQAIFFLVATVVILIGASTKKLSMEIEQHSRCVSTDVGDKD